MSPTYRILDFSTGKRRYGHPALTGVLPAPWLPLKKGQTLANYNHHGEADDSDGGGGQAVVLTLRRKSSNLRSSSKKRRSVANLLEETGATPQQPNGAESNGVPTPASETGSSTNPWRDLPSTSATQPVRHRLSFDHATGIIMLPDDSEWLGEEDSVSSDEGGWQANEAPPLRRSEGTADTSEGDDEVAGRRNARFLDDEVDSDEAMASPTRRHTTYYHHPERRSRNLMPGAFSR